MFPQEIDHDQEKTFKLEVITCVEVEAEVDKCMKYEVRSSRQSIK